MQSLSLGILGMSCSTVLYFWHLQAISIVLISRRLCGIFFKELNIPFLLPHSHPAPGKLWKWFQIEIINISLELCSLHLVFGTFFLNWGSCCLFNLHHYCRSLRCETYTLPQAPCTWEGIFSWISLYFIELVDSQPDRQEFAQVKLENC